MLKRKTTTANQIAITILCTIVLTAILFTTIVRSKPLFFHLPIWFGKELKSDIIYLLIRPHFHQPTDNCEKNFIATMEKNKMHNQFWLLNNIVKTNTKREVVIWNVNSEKAENFDLIFAPKKIFTITQNKDGQCIIQ